MTMFSARRRLLLPLLGLVGLMMLASCQRSRESPVSPPNFIILFADDLGYGDIGPFGSTLHRTPNLDRMAAEGRKFTNFYVTSGLCTPSRASLMTGSYPKRINMHKSEAGIGVLSPGSSRGLNPDEITLAEILKEQGYATGMVGKWHLGDQPVFLPTRQGFDSYFGLPYSNDQGAFTFPQYNMPPLPLMRGEEVIEVEPDQSLLTGRYTEAAVQFITANKDRPFFLYLAHSMPHYPADAGEQFKGKSANGIYGDSVEELDWSTGRILSTLKDLKIDDKTLVVFTSDNGGVPNQGSSSGPLRGTKATTWEGGMRVPTLMRWPGTIPAGTICSEMILSLDILPTFAELAGGTVPSDRMIDGKNVWPLIAGTEGSETPHDRFYYYQVGSLAAVRSGKWKLHVGRRERQPGEERSRWNTVLELYDMEDDMGETTNLAEQHPDVVERLQKLLAEARDDLGDDSTGAEGEYTRPAGHVDDTDTLTHASDSSD